MYACMCPDPLRIIKIFSMLGCGSDKDRLSIAGYVFYSHREKMLGFMVPMILPSWRRTTG